MTAPALEMVDVSRIHGRGDTRLRLTRRTA